MGVRLIVDELPPPVTKIWLINQWGVGFAGEYHETLQVEAWGPLPALTPEQKRRLAALRGAGHDTTRNRSQHVSTESCSSLDGSGLCRPPGDGL